MDWLNMLKTTNDGITKNTDTPRSVLPELPKVSCYCPEYDGHCSGRLPFKNYPAECLRISCEYFTN